MHLEFDQDDLRQLIEPIVAATLEKLEADRVKLNSERLGYPELEAASLLGVPRHTFWDHLGTKEWLQYDFSSQAKVGSVEVYWFDDRNTGGCWVHESWRLLYKKGDAWKPVTGASSFGTEVDKFNRVTFDPIETDGR